MNKICLLLAAILGTISANAWADPNYEMENQFAGIDSLMKAMDAAGALPGDPTGSDNGKGKTEDVAELKKTIMRNLDKPTFLAFEDMTRLIGTTSDKEWKQLDVGRDLLGTKRSWMKRMVTHYLKHHQDLVIMEWSYFLPTLFKLDKEATKSVFGTLSDRDRAVVLDNLRAEWNKDFHSELSKIK